MRFLRILPVLLSAVVFAVPVDDTKGGILNPAWEPLGLQPGALERRDYPHPIYCKKCDDAYYKCWERWRDSLICSGYACQSDKEICGKQRYGCGYSWACRETEEGNQGTRAIQEAHEKRSLNPSPTDSDASDASMGTSTVSAAEPRVDRALCGMCDEVYKACFAKSSSSYEYSKKACFSSPYSSDTHHTCGYEGAYILHSIPDTVKRAEVAAPPPDEPEYCKICNVLHEGCMRKGGDDLGCTQFVCSAVIWCRISAFRCFTSIMCQVPFNPTHIPDSTLDAPR
ncbi:hypothetical protein P152DRAFT_447203 [Eremomyces bilateralis CBS 781.70]|uniref:Uncharacterized protein n=1 Tax=Eremomyces bilateralis CBS 781.70 TaxID=1392243 RepID=A0A6G1GA16_9PEZI|nr:uncharacterized protein P152DRAFT_447203 [Eremomyces bilateralis CBS 781.70]KAF1814915.1 hypothetical protein P152DRAFT_447203 [Eremomyces bilateralis CBS 781.70]